MASASRGMHLPKFHGVSKPFSRFTPCGPPEVDTEASGCHGFHRQAKGIHDSKQKMAPCCAGSIERRERVRRRASTLWSGSQKPPRCRGNHGEVPCGVMVSHERTSVMMPMAHEKGRHTTISQGMCPCCRLLIRWDMDLQMSRPDEFAQARPGRPNPTPQACWNGNRERVVRGSLASLHDTIQLVES